MVLSIVASALDWLWNFLNNDCAHAQLWSIRDFFAKLKRSVGPVLANFFFGRGIYLDIHTSPLTTESMLGLGLGLGL